MLSGNSRNHVLGTDFRAVGNKGSDLDFVDGLNKQLLRGYKKIVQKC